MDGERADKAPMMDKRASSFFSSVSRQVQFLLDHNVLLINEINLNHEAKIPEGLTRNVTLIRQLNSNINKVVDLYASLSSNFANVFENLQEVNSGQNNTASRPVSNSSDPGVPAAAQASGQNPHKKIRSIVHAIPAIEMDVNRGYLTPYIQENPGKPEKNLLDINYR